MTIGDGETSLLSWMGCACTYFVVIIVGLYSLQKIDVLLKKKDVDVLSTINDYYYSDDFIFSHENGLAIAVAFTAYDTERSWSLDPAYGEIVFNNYTWGPNPDGSF